MNPTAYQLATAAALRADGDHATADAILALSPEDVADILLGTAAPRVESFSYRGPFKGERGGTYWLQEGDQDTDDNRVYSPGNPDDGTGGGTDPTRQDIAPGFGKASRVLAGATAGGLTGGALGGPLGMAVGTVAGAALGSDTGQSILGGIRALLNRGEEPEGIARKVAGGDPEAVAAVRADATAQARAAAANLAAEPPGDPAEVRAGWAQASAKMRAGDAAELGGHVEAMAGARTPDKVDAAFKAMGGFLAKLVGAPLRLAFGAIKAFGRFALTTGKPYLVWAASLATGAAVLAAPPVALGLGLIGPATAFALAPVAVGGAIGAGMVGRSAQRRAGGPATFAEGPADYTPAGPDGKRAVELLATSQAAGVSTLTEVCDRAVRRLLMLPHPEHAAHLFEDDELHRIAGALAGGIATADLLGRSRVRRRAEMAERVAAFAEKDDPGPPGPPPRPGLTWKRETQRWVRKGKEHAAELTRRAKEAPAKLKNKVRTYVEKKYAKLAERYGENGAKAVMAASLLLLPVPVPGASFVPIALAEAVRAMGKGVKAVGFAEADVSDELVQAVVEFLTELYAEAGEAVPAIDPAKVRAALERDEVDEDDAHTFAEWTRYEGPEGGRGWKNAAGEVRYQVEMPADEPQGGRHGGNNGGGAVGGSPPGDGGPPARVDANRRRNQSGGEGRDASPDVGLVAGASGDDPVDPPSAVKIVGPGGRANSEVDRQATERAVKALGVRAGIDDLPAIIGAPTGADVTVGSHPDGTVWVRVSHPQFKADRSIRRDAEGRPYIKNDNIEVAESARGSGIGTRVFAAQVSASQKAGFAYIQCLASGDAAAAAAGGPNGYYTWPRLGYDMSLTDPATQYEGVSSAYEAARSAFPNAETVLDIFMSPGGREWWRENGTDIEDARFDLAPGSRSLAILAAYLRERRKVAAMSEPGAGKSGEGMDLSPEEEAALERAWESLVSGTVATFAEQPDDPFHDFAEPVPAVEPAAAVDYFRRLVPTLADDPGRYGLALGRHAFTLAVATEQTILQKVKDAILAGLRTGTDATADVQDVLDAAGVSPRNPQYAEMVTRTATMDALNSGAVAEMQTPEMQEAFPVWRYDGILDSRTGDDHRPLIGRHYPSTANFADVRGPRVWNCRCSPTPVFRSEAADLIRAGKVERG